MKLVLVLMLLFFLMLAVVSCRPASGSGGLSPGEQTFRANCQTCHRLPRADIKTDEQWPTLVAHYGKKAKLSQTQIELITFWLIANN